MNLFQNSGLVEIHLFCLFARCLSTAGLESDFFRYLLSTYQLLIISSLGFWWIHDSKSDSHSIWERQRVTFSTASDPWVNFFINKNPQIASSFCYYYYYYLLLILFSYNLSGR